MATRTRVIGTTRLSDKLASGGMGAVYRGRQETLDRVVAVKVILPKLKATDADALERFRREATVLAGLQHENIVAIYDLAEKNDQLFMVLEMVDGVDLETVLDRGALPLDVALAIAVGIARALEHAHFRRVIHRDIKPANVLLSRQGVVKLVDFGLAKDLELDGLTKTGMLVGTPLYISPEQLAGRLADRRCDLYALGVVLFRCLCGSTPYPARDRNELFAKIAQGKRLRVKDAAPHIPRSIQKIVDRCLQPAPDKRWQYAAQLRAALEVELSKRLQCSPGARLVGFLQERQFVTADLTEELDLAEVSFAEVLGDHALNEADSDDGAKDEAVAAAPPVPELPVRRLGWFKVTAVLLAILAIAALVLWLVAPATFGEIWSWLGG